MSNEKELGPLDIRLWTKEEACFRLWKSEHTYLMSRGWEALVGTQSDNYLIAPGDDIDASGTRHYTHDEAMVIQKEKDNYHG